MKRSQSKQVKKSAMSAQGVASLVRHADPLPTDASEEGLSPRARRELGLLVDEARPVPPTWRPRRRGVLIGAVACGAAAMVAAVAVLAASGPDEPSGGLVADEPHYPSTAELEGAADLIVRAKLGKGAERTVDDITSTEAPAEVLATAKGTAPGGRVTVSYTPPDSGGPETAALEAGEEYVFLLERQDDGRFTLVNSAQGSYGVSGDRAVPTGDNAVTLSPGVLKALRLTGTAPARG
ncbi:hypothetical protein [Streptomyces sp. CB01580]|uniref:hypothetical protein n=1 Tax=Streptomyces sp. CB01580 TaxID=1703933 RepID=UPI000AD3B9E1|nr:hypothetical protein [Streptomyces sp. CB01580]